MTKLSATPCIDTARNAMPPATVTSQTGTPGHWTRVGSRQARATIQPSTSAVRKGQYVVQIPDKASVSP